MSQKSRMKNRLSPLLIDSGPLLLLLAGSFDIDLIGKARRLKQYSPDQYELMVHFLLHRKVFVTPGVLAEVTNLAGYVREKKFEEFLANSLSTLEKIGEYHIAKDVILSSEIFTKMGYTDVSLILAAKECNAELLTGDHHLFQRVDKLGIKATHIGSFRELETRFSQNS